MRHAREQLFPVNSLQERTDNFLPYFVEYGKEFFDTLLSFTQPLAARFQIITDQGEY
ncbi:MAG TPA: bacillithiol biosynthesis BshC [Chitinophagaceae bacterium]